MPQKEKTLTPNNYAHFEELVNLTLFEILERRVDLDEYFARKDQEELYDCQ